MLIIDFSHSSYSAVFIKKLLGIFILTILILLTSAQLFAQEVSIQILSTYSLEENARVNIGPQIGWGPEEVVTDAPPPPPPGAFDMRIQPGFFRDLFVFEDSTWYGWDITFQNQAGLDTLLVFFDRCELLNNVQQAYIVNRDSSVVIDMVSDTLAVIDPSFNRNFTVWFLSKNTISDDPPLVVAPLPDATLDPNTEIPYRINVSSFFESVSGSSLRYTAQTNTELVNLVATQSGIIELTLKDGVQDTSVTVVVTAFGAGCGFIEQSFTVDIPAIINLAVELVQPLPDFTLQGNFPTRVLIPNLNDYFVDGNETQPDFALTYNASVVNVFLSGSALLATSVSGVFNVQTTVTITATDGEFNVSDDIVIAIGEPNRVPVKTAQIPDIVVDPNFGFLEAAYFDNYFSDPDGDNIEYALSYDISKINAGLQGDTLFLASVNGIKNEIVNVELTISDGLLSLQDSFRVVINDNLPPLVSRGDTTLVLESGFERHEWLDLSSIFNDPENQVLNFTVNALQQGIAIFTVESGKVIIEEIEGVLSGSTMVQITASDAFQSVSASYYLSIIRRNSSPTVSQSTLEIVDNYSNDLAIRIPLNTYFSDPDNDSLSYSISVRNNVNVVVSNDSTTIADANGNLSIALDTDSSVVRIIPLLNTRIDEDILIEATDGEFTVGLVVQLKLYPQGEELPNAQNSNAAKKLYRTFPNPAQTSSFVKIVYEIPENTTTSELVLTEVNVYNILGRFVKRLVLQQQEAGVYTVNFDTRGLAAGTYIYTLRTPTGLISRKLTLID